MINFCGFLTSECKLWKWTISTIRPKVTFIQTEHICGFGIEFAKSNDCFGLKFHLDCTWRRGKKLGYLARISSIIWTTKVNRSNAWPSINLFFLGNDWKSKLEIWVSKEIFGTQQVIHLAWSLSKEFWS